MTSEIAPKPTASYDYRTPCPVLIRSKTDLHGCLQACKILLPKFAPDQGSSRAWFTSHPRTPYQPVRAGEPRLFHHTPFGKPSGSRLGRSTAWYRNRGCSGGD